MVFAFNPQADTAQDKLSKTATVPPRVSEKQPMHYHLANLQGIGRRSSQEDAFAFGNALDAEAIAERGLLIVAADGMGGLADGKAASETVTSTLLAQFQRFDMTEPLAPQLLDAVSDANDRVWDKLGGRGGSTVVAGLIYDEKLYFTSVGDSYLFLLHDRELIRLNRSQNVLSRDRMDAILVGELDPYTPLENRERDAITHFLGMGELEETDSLRRPLLLTPGDVLLFCSDGVGGVLESACIEDCLSCATPEEMCAALEGEIQKRNLKYQDNYTALIVQCRN